MANFRLVGPFVKIAGFREKEIIIDSPKKLKMFEFVTKFELLYDRMIILVNGESATLETLVYHSGKTYQNTSNEVKGMILDYGQNHNGIDLRGKKQR